MSLKADVATIRLDTPWDYIEPLAARDLPPRRVAGVSRRVPYVTKEREARGSCVREFSLEPERRWTPRRVRFLL